MGVSLETHGQLIARLQGEIDKALAFVAFDEPFALLDFPDHSNVGDSAIWLGELAFFAGAGRRPSYVCNLKNIDWRDLDRVVPKGTIFIHGGGNFGDIWPRHQAFREEVLARLAGRRIVQLPQSVHFTSSGQIEQMARLIAEHGQFTLCVRDRSSLDFATARFDCPVILCPDMAFCLGEQRRMAKPHYETLFLLRTDKEKADTGCIETIKTSPGLVRMDWLLEPSGTRLNARYLAIAYSLASTLKGGLQRQRLREEYYRQLAMKRLRRGLRLLGSYAYVVSDRLHVHILSTLLGVRHCMLDNNYGKIERFMDTWSTAWNGVLRTDSVASALSQRS